MGLTVSQSHQAGLHEGRRVRRCRACAEAGRAETTEAVTAGRDRASDLRRTSEGHARPTNLTARESIPQLQTIARDLSADRLAQIRWETVPGDHVAIYRRRGVGGAIRILIAGPDRLQVVPPDVLDGDWVRIASLEIWDDAEQELGERVP